MASIVSVVWPVDLWCDGGNGIFLGMVVGLFTLVMVEVGLCEDF